MTEPSTPAGDAAPPVEQFRPSSGYVLGWIGAVGFMVLALVSLAGSAPATAAVFAWLAVLLAIGLLRPRVVAHADHVLLRNSFRDTAVPWHLIDAVAVGYTLRLQVGREVHHSSAISRKMRSMPGREAPQASGPGPLGLNQMVQGLAPTPTADPLPQQVLDYPGHVESRLRELVQQRRGWPPARTVVTTGWALVPISTLALATVVCGLVVVAS